MINFGDRTLDITQLAKLLQLVGFLLASVFGGILLDEVVGGKVAKGFTSLFVGFVNRLRKFMQRLAKDIIPPEEPEYPTSTGWEALAFFFFWSGSLTALIVGWLKHIPVLLWIGVSLYSVYALGWLVGVPLLIFVPRLQRRFGMRRPVRIPNGKELSAKEFFPDYAVIAAALVSGIGCIVLFALFFFSYFLKASSYIMKMLANPRVPKAPFVVLGFLILLAGLIIDAIAAF